MPFCLSCVLINCSIAVKGHQEQGKLQKETFNWGHVYSFGGLILYHHGGKIGGRQTYCWRNSWAKLFILICLQQGDKDRHWPGVDFWNFQVHLQRHTSSNKVTPTPTKPYLNSTTSFEIMEVNYIQTTTEVCFVCIFSCKTYLLLLSYWLCGIYCLLHWLLFSFLSLVECKFLHYGLMILWISSLEMLLFSSLILLIYVLFLGGVNLSKG